MNASVGDSSEAAMGVVIIGRNEGDRLVRCLASIAGLGFPVAYVDSGSTDGSVAHALSVGAEVVELDMSIPFCAARARNEGFGKLSQMAPRVELVQFIDGDCEMVDGWFDAAVAAMGGDDRLGAVCGVLLERFPDASMYNRICDMEWPREIGEVAACGGIFVARVIAFEGVGRFDPSVPAGEEPELCQRLRADGWTVRRIDQPMCLHDSAMSRFGQWWRRQIRTGYSGWDVARRFGSGPDRPFVRSVRSARFWTCVVPAFAVVCGLSAGFIIGPLVGVLVAAAILAVVPLQAARIALRTRRKGRSWGVAIVYGLLTMLGKFAQLQGQMRYASDLARGRGALIVEHRSAGPQKADGAKST